MTLHPRLSPPTLLRSFALILIASGGMVAAPANARPPAGSVFTYQGQLSNAGSPLNGTASLRFRLYTLAAGGSQIGSTLTLCNVALTDGLFTADLDFGAGAFNGDERWLEIGVQAPAGNCLTFTTLTPRQLVAAAPYAIRSLAPWETSGSTTFYNDGNVGIGTSAPAATLEILDGDASLRVTSNGTSGTSTLDLKGVTPGGLTSNVLGTLRFLDSSNSVRASISSSLGLFANPLNFAVAGVTEMVLSGNGNLGVGTTLPVTKLQVVGGTDSDPSGGGFVVLGETNSTNISLDNNEIMALNNGATSTLFLNHDGGDVSICANGNGQVGVGTSPTSAQLTVFNSLFVNGGASPRIDVGPNGFILMDSNADIVITNGGLEVNTPSAGSTFFNRVNPDGTLINFKNAGTTAGGISVIGSTVSYNTFTGSHLAWTDSSIEQGSLVTLTGDNRRAHPGPNCEPVYGIALSSKANQPNCLGSYLMAPDAEDPESAHLVAAVGNGEMWVVETELGDIEPGHGLISSDVHGCAMRDDPRRFEVGHVVAKAAEGVRWSTVAPGPDGRKRVLLSVFFGAYERQGDPQLQRHTLEIVETLQRDNDHLRARLDELTAQIASLSSALSIPAAAGGAR